MIAALALSTLRTRKAGFIGAFLALLCAAALVTACGVLLETGLRGGIPTERYAGAPIVVGADQNLHWTKKKKGKSKVKTKALTERAWLDASAADRLRTVPGVAVVPEVTFPATALDRSGRPLSGERTSWGHAWESARLTPYTLRAGRAPAAPGEVVLDAGAGVDVGSEVVVQATDVPAKYRVVGVTGTALRRQAGVFFSTGEARRLAGHEGQVSALGVLPRPGTDITELTRSVEGALAGTPAKVFTGAGRGPLEFQDAAKAKVTLISLGGALGGTSLLVAVLVVVGTFALSIQQRQREIAVLRAIAATPRQVRAMIGREALIVGVLAAVPGSVAGLGVAVWLRARFVELGAMPEALGLAFSPFPMFAAVAATIGAAWVAARVTGRRTARIRPTEALGDAALEPARTGWFRTLAGLVVLALYAVVLAVLSGLDTEAAASPVTFLSVVLAAVAVALLGPLLTRGAVAVLAVPLRLSPAAGFLAAANTRAGARRLASAVTPLALAVAMSSTILFVQTTTGHAAQRQAEAGTLAEYGMAGPAGVPGATAEAARRIPGVTAVTEVVGTTLRIGQDKYPAQGVTPDGAARTLDLDVQDGSLDRLTTGTVALSTTAAGHRGARIGDRVPLTLGDGTRTGAMLVATYRRGLGFGDVTLPHRLVAAHVDAPLARAVLIKAEPRARTPLNDLAKSQAGLRLLDSGGMGVQRRAQQDAAAQVNYVALGLIIAFTAIALVNTLAMITGDRGRELALLRLAGGTRRQVLRMLRWETLILVLTGVAAGTVIALGTLSAFAAGMAGGAVPYAPPLTYLGIVAAVTVLALAATALPGRVALRANAAEAIGARD